MGSLFSVSAFAEDRTLQLPNGEEIHYRVITEPAESARETAKQLLKHLAAGDIQGAAALSNAPMRRYEVLRDYRNQVGEEEFKRVYAQYQSPANRLFLEAAIGRRHLLVWDLGEAGNHLAGQYYVEVDGKFLLDDESNEERAQLARLLQTLRKRTTH
ncbi:MAG: hypothetical protein EPO20_00245 [Betaproteobacteria bacterium]|nr:MAG: hypothetical protein EPO20_00245 [Betaproteobacteria bacterium]